MIDHLVTLEMKSFHKAKGNINKMMRPAPKRKKRYHLQTQRGLGAAISRVNSSSQKDKENFG